MITRKSLGAVALATTWFVPLAAFAQSAAPTPVGTQSTGNSDVGQNPFEVNPNPAPTSVPVGTQFTGNIEIGVMGVGGTNPDQAGRYNGLITRGFDAYGNFDISGSDAWNSTGTRYYEYTGTNLVFQTGNYLGSGLGSGARSSTSNMANEGSLAFKAGDQGRWEIGGFYNAITYTGNVIDSLYTVNGNLGILNNGLAPWGGATATKAGSVTSLTVPQLRATGAMLPVQVGTRRDTIGGNGKYIWGDWTITLAFQHEHKSGSMEESFDGVSGGTAFALPIDYDTDRIDVTGSYATRKYQAIIQYTYSHFADNNTFINLPFYVSNTKLPYQESAAYSTPPSNSAHYLTVMLGANDLIPRTRVNLNARVGLEMQDDPFAPNSADPYQITAPGYGQLNQSLQGTSADALDAVATVYQIKLNAASHPLTNLETNVFYGVDSRSVSENQYGVYGEGTGMDATLAGSKPYAYVVPQDWLKENAGFTLGYRILPESNTRLKAGYRWDGVDRSNAQVGRSSTSTATVGVMSEIGSKLDGSLDFAYADRSGTLSYLTPWQNLDEPQGTPGSPTYSGAYYQAPMTSESVTARADYSPREDLGGSLFLQLKNENYHYPAATAVGTGVASGIPITGVGEGIKQDYALSLGPDINYRPVKGVNVHLFYTYELLFFNNVGNGACATVAEAATAGCAGTAGYFQNKYTSGTHTIGINGEWQLNDKLKLQADYTFSYGTVMFGEFNGVFVTNPNQSYQNVTNYPDINSTMNNVRLTARYQLKPGIELVAQANYMGYHDNNWQDTANAIQGAGTTAVSILTPGYASPNYNVFAILFGVKFQL